MTRLTRCLAATLLLVSACGKPQEAKKIVAAVDSTGPTGPDAAPPPPPELPQPLPPVTGEVSVASGKALFAARCVSCHGEDGKGKGPGADKLRLAPTDLTTTGYLCRSTTGRPVAIPSDTDIETALDRGTHRDAAELLRLEPAQRRSLTMYVKTLARDFAGDPQPLSPVPPEPLDDAGSRQRGRMLYLQYGCGSCHGLSGKGDGEPSTLRSVQWNGRALTALSDLTDQEHYLCGSDPARVYRTIALGEGAGGAMIMPPYGAMAELTWRPEGNPEEWGKKLEGKITADELAAWRAFSGQLPAKADVQAMKPIDRRARAGALLWDLVHYVRSM